MTDLVAVLGRMSPAQRAAYVAALEDPADLDVVEAAIAEAEARARAAADERRARHEHESAMARHARWFVDPVAFATEAIRWPEGRSLRPYQAEALDRLARRHRLAVRSLHGAGKTGIGAFAVLWFAVTRDARAIPWKVPTTASVGRQLSEYLWPEIRLWAKRLRWDLIGREPFNERRELLDESLNLAHGSAFAASPSDPARIEGAHAPQLLVLLDEGKSIQPAMFDAVEGAFSTAGADTADEAFALLLSTPGAPTGRFADICHHRAGYEDWDTLHITLAMALEAGAVSGEWAEARARQWGTESAMYRNRVLGEFAADETDSVIPLAWVEAANERWHAMVAANGHAVSSEVGIDVARYGDDRSVVASVAGDLVGMPQFLPRGDSTTTAGAAIAHCGRRPAGPFVVIDADGIGAGVFDQLGQERELPARMAPFHAAEGTNWRDRSGELTFGNQRAAAWWNLRELLDPSHGATLGLPPSDGLTGDLCTPRWRFGVGGRIFVESKEDIRKRLKRSTDEGDAVVMALWGRYLRARRNLRPAAPSNGHRVASITGDLLEAAL